MKSNAFPIWGPLFGGAVIVLAIYVCVQNYPWWKAGEYGASADKWLGWGFGGLVTAFLFAGAFGLGCWISSIIGHDLPQDWSLRGKWTLVAMRNSDSVAGRISGGIFLMSGYIGSQQVYNYYTLNRDGSFKPGKWETDSNTAVYEEDRTDGLLVVYDPKFKKPWMGWIGDTVSATRGEFHIPKGSLKKAFTIE